MKNTEQRFRVMEVDNFDRHRDPSPKWASPSVTEQTARKIAEIINAELCPGGHDRRYWIVVDTKFYEKKARRAERDQ